ncbi:amino acid ABC transporter substrate-binding protein, PAAT family [Microbulbifer donghaiensis]|uniref:Amino acid ABC transporter substrate-binding protein, PAAT family n=1 Tax=Microbulbifer donghaiensis TaxID=494016 RepID=A0A1M4X096_9GAMM|nr:transporter substrate-binding domain-containing protein [Microbulbifer donghaiensis]SHE86928.1 amino acid ABC transporter substrate-binding protein, PAAT family [Microbulbifer donghaiensis]
MLSRYKDLQLLGATLLAVVVLVLVTACGKPDRKAEEAAPAEAAIAAGETSDLPSGQKQVEFTNYIETGDLAALKKRKIIRFATFSSPLGNPLPRSAIVTQRHIELAIALARRLRLEPMWVDAESPSHAISLVEDGHADIIADNLTATSEREKRLNFTQPLMHIEQKLITGPRGPAIDSPQKLHNVRLLVLKGTTHLDTAKRLIKENPGAGITLQEVPYNDDLDVLMDLVNENPNQVSILDSNEAEAMREYRDDIRIGASVSEKENIAWGLRKDSKRLLATVNNYLTRHLVTEREDRITDWREIKKSGLIRFLTYNGPTTYFLWKGVLMGFDYDLAKAFADKHNLQLQVIVVPYDENLIDWLKAGRGDFAGASTTIIEGRKEQGISFTASYLESPERVVSNKNRPPIDKIQDLTGRTLTLRAFSSFIPTANTIRDSGIDVEIKIAPPGMSLSQIFNMIAEGLLDATIADSGSATIEASLQPNLDAGTLLGDPKPQGWMVVTKNWHLLQNLSKFIEEFRKTEQYQRKYQVYFEPDKRFTQRVSARVIPGQDLSPFDELIKDSSLNYDFDWRLVVAQMWQESNFDPKAVSPVGAQGLMQLMPATAEEMGFPPPVFEPDRNIQAGVKYLNWVRDRFDPTLPTLNKLWFTLAAYNAGYGHLLDAQRLAEELGLDPNVWFGNVEVAMLKLAEPQYFNKARYGYVRGSEPVQYVRKISNLYKAYVDVATGEVSVRPPLRKPEIVPAMPERGTGGSEQITEQNTP